MDFLAWVTIGGLACAYCVRVLLLQPKISHEGPFPLKSTFVLLQMPEQPVPHIQRFAFFDIIRFIFGAYKRVTEINGTPTTQRIYTPRELWIAEVWTCPLCLSFWVALPINALISANFHTPLSLSIITHLAIACISYLINDLTSE